MVRRVPVARTRGLLIEEFESDLVVYDLERDQAHCLNPPAAAVFQLCDGTATWRQLEEALRLKVGPASDERVLEMTVQQLSAAHLLEQPGVETSARSRRDLATRLGISVSRMPQVMSLPVPNALAAASHCLDPGKPCGGHFDCCSFSCNPGSGRCN